MTWPSVSIGITTRNRRAMVLRAIESVQRQDYAGPIEIVVVDDHSEDDTVEALTPLSAAGAIKLYPNEAHFGIAYAKNSALLHGSGELRGILDSDDFYAPGFVSACVRALGTNPDVGLVYTDNIVVNAAGKEIEKWPALDWSLQRFIETRNLRGDSWLARWSVLDGTPLHDENFQLEVDYDLFYMLAERTRFKRVPEFLHYVTQHDGRTSTERAEAAAFWHAAGLAKYGHQVAHAHERARQFGKAKEWASAIERGAAFGKELQELHELGLWRLPRPNANILGKWESLWASTGGQQHWVDDGRIADILKWIPQRASVLDLGCGNGAQVRAIKTHRPDGKVAGSDFAAAQITALREQHPEIEWSVLDLQGSNYLEGDRRYDIIVCAEVIEHLNNPLRVFRYARKKLTRNGHLILTTPFYEDVRDSYHVWALGPVDIVRMARLHGGTVMHMQKTGSAERTMLYVIGFD